MPINEYINPNRWGTTGSWTSTTTPTPITFSYRITGNTTGFRTYSTWDNNYRNREEDSVSYSTYAQLLSKTYQQYTSPTEYAPTFGGDHDLFSNLGVTKKFSYLCLANLVNAPNKDGLQWYIDNHIYSLQEGINKLYESPVTVDQVYDVVRKLNSRRLHVYAQAEEIISMIKEELKITNEHLLNTVGNHFSVKFDQDGFVLQYVPAKNYHKVGTLGVQDFNKVGITLGIGKFLASNFILSDKQIEHFVDRTKLAMLGGKIMFELVKGDDIKLWYHKSMYSRTYDIGDLSNSCMRYDKCQYYFDIYTKNPQVEMLIATENGKLVGRTLIWSDGKNKYHDRIYGSRVIQWAMAEFATKLGIRPRAELYKTKIKLDNVTFDFYPYMDTLNLIDTETKIASNGATLSNLTTPNKTGRYLNSTNGSWVTI